MTGDEFKGVLRRLGRSQVGFAQEIGVSRRTVHLWAERGPPAYAIHLLGLIERHSAPTIQDGSARRSYPDPEPVLGDMYARATSEGAGLEFLQAVERWIRISRDK